MRTPILSLVLVQAVLTAAAHPKQNPARVDEIAAFLPEKPGFPFLHVSNRAFWDRAPKRWLAEAEKIVAKGRTKIDESRYEEVKWNTHAVVNEMMAVVAGETVENRGRFLPTIVGYLDDICSARTWMNPYHDRSAFGNFRGKYRSVDLNSGCIAMDLAVLLDRFRGKLPRATVDRVMAYFDRQIIAPYLHAARKDDFSRMGWFFGNSNWNVACHWQSVMLAASVIEDRRVRAEFVEAAERAAPYYLAGFSKEGYCQEGLDYWNYGFGEFTRLCHVVRNMTGCRVDLSKLPRAEACALAPFGFELAHATSPQFNDGTASVPSRHTVYLGHFLWPGQTSDYMRGMNPFDIGWLQCGLVSELPGNRVGDVPPADDAPLRTLFEDAQILVARPPREGSFTLSACLKGGHNGVPHNHNDLGQFIVALGRTQMVQDPAGKVYDLETFTAKRYNHPMLNSYGHAVPLIDGTLQAEGAGACSKIVAKSFSDAEDRLTLDLTAAYTNDILRSLTREMIYRRAAKEVVIRDRAVYAREGVFETPISTYGRVERLGSNRFSIVRETELGTKRLDFTVRTGGAPWHVKEEKIPNPKRTEPTRWAVVIDGRGKTFDVEFVFTPGEMPPDVWWKLSMQDGKGDHSVGPFVTNWFYSTEQALGVKRLGDGRWRFTCSRFRGYNRTMGVDFVLDAELRGGETLLTGSIRNLEGGTRLLSFEDPRSGFCRRYRAAPGESVSIAPVSFDRSDAEGRPFRPLVIGITEQFHLRDGHPLSSVGYEYVNAVFKAGHIPLVLVRTGDTNRLAKVMSTLDGVILTGGMDVAPARYGEKPSPKCGRPNLERDAFDYSVLDYAVAHGLPVLGVCRGVQMLNVYFGGTLWQDLPSEYPGVLRHRGNGIATPAHELSIETGSWLSRLLGTTSVGINSQHHQAVKALAPGFRIAARSPDGVVEAIENEKLGILGVQGHPEGFVWLYDDPVWIRLFRDFWRR